MIDAHVRRSVALLLLAAATVLATLLPPAHIHLAVEHDDHHHDHATATEHSHWDAHHASRTALDDDDGRVIFVDHPAKASSVDTTFTQPAAAVIAVLILPAASAFTAAERLTSGNSPRDGPSRATSPLRAPPASFDTL